MFLSMSTHIAYWLNENTPRAAPSRTSHPSWPSMHLRTFWVMRSTLTPCSSRGRGSIPGMFISYSWRSFSASVTLNTDSSSNLTTVYPFCFLMSSARSV